MGMQKAFWIDTYRIEALPITRDFFPDLATPTHGIRGQATPYLEKALDRMLLEAVRRPDLVGILGPEAAPRPRGR